MGSKRLFVDKTHSIGMRSLRRLLLLTLQLEIELLLTLYRLQMYAVPISISSRDAEAQCTREVEPEPLPEFSGDRCDGHCDAELCVCCTDFRCMPYQ